MITTAASISWKFGFCSHYVARGGFRRVWARAWSSNMMRSVSWSDGACFSDTAYMAWHVYKVDNKNFK